MKLVIYEVKNRKAYITLNRPEKRNAMSPELVTELKQAFAQAASEDEVRVVILQANGKVFSAGADLGYIEQLQSNTYDENLKDSDHLRTLFSSIYHHPKPVIAKVHGHAIAGGCGLATVCDFVYASEVAKFGYTEVRIGFIPALVSVFLIRKIGEARAREMLLTGALYDAQEVQDLGLINKVMAESELDSAVDGLANMLVEKNSGHSITLTKNLIANSQDLSFEEAMDHAAKCNAEARATSDCRRGIQAFLNKEKITW